jgi:hypothetical protein
VKERGDRKGEGGRRDVITNDDVYAKDADVSLRPFTLLYNFSFVYIMMDGEGKR